MGPPGAASRPNAPSPRGTAKRRLSLMRTATSACSSVTFMGSSLLSRSILFMMSTSSFTSERLPPIMWARTPATSPHSRHNPRRGCSCRILKVTKSSGWTSGYACRSW